MTPHPKTCCQYIVANAVKALPTPEGIILAKKRVVKFGMDQRYGGLIGT